ncbi:MAG TPA: molybdopterin-dependent oxidoreductase [Candidatus Baltobacteraceae bacterium]|jgi:DMSO/TMAO reductase YedYZ molybdopterin-dependent catalytic subunit|nr:molybdopterin-dependent oxidoreductase [Candidatus Baltobacteraceae bacterium]
MKRRLFIASTLSGALAACAPIGNKLNQNAAFHRLLESAEGVNETIIGTHGHARFYRPQDISADFPIDSLDTPSDAVYSRLIGEQFRPYRLIVNGLVAYPQALPLDRLNAMMKVSQITRHDCVEGWSAIAQWQGVRLSDVLALAVPGANARYVVFHSFDQDTNGTPYYESLSLAQAAHPQTLLALRQNGKPILPERGAPVRLTIPTQLGYKSAKWVARIELVQSLAAIGSGKGGYWEDQGYEWYAGI